MIVVVFVAVVVVDVDVVANGNVDVDVDLGSVVVCWHSQMQQARGERFIFSFYLENDYYHLD